MATSHAAGSLRDYELAKLRLLSARKIPDDFKPVSFRPDQFAWMKEAEKHFALKDKLHKPALLMLPSGDVPKPLLMLPAGAIAKPVPQDAPLVVAFGERVAWKQAAEQGQKLVALYGNRYRWQTGEVMPRKVAKAA